MTKQKQQRGRFSPEVRERAVRLVREQLPQHASQWAAIAAIAPKLGCTTETLRRWLHEDEREAGARPGSTRAEEDRVKALEREVKELRRTNEILRKARVDSIGQRNTPSGLLDQRASWPRSVVPACRRTSDKKSGSAGEPATPSR